MSHFLSLRACMRETGVHRNTLSAWVKAGKLRRTKAGLVDSRSVERLKHANKTGRPHALSQLEKSYLVRDTASLAAPFLTDPEGLPRFSSVAKAVVAHHAAHKRAELRALLCALYAAI